MRSPFAILLTSAACALTLTLSLLESAQAESAETSAVAVAETSALADEGALLTVVPVPGELSSEFGMRSDPVRRKRRQRGVHKIHKGLDFIARRGTLVHAAGPGVVIRAQVSGSYGRLVIIEHGGGLQTRYAHLRRFKVRKGERIDAGQVVGLVGSSGRVTGPHLHFEVRKNGVAVSPASVVKFKVPHCSARSRHCKTAWRRKLRSADPNS